MPFLLAVGIAFLIGSIESVSPETTQERPAARADRVVDVSRLGPQVGEKVPDFTLPDQDGRQRSLASLMGEQGLVLVFSRSADW